MTKQQFNDLSEKYLSGLANADEEKILFAWYEVLQKKQVEGAPVSVEEKNSLFSALQLLLDKKDRVASTESIYPVKNPVKTKNPAAKAYVFTGHIISKSLKRIVDVFHFSTGFGYRKEGSRK